MSDAPTCHVRRVVRTTINQQTGGARAIGLHAFGGSCLGGHVLADHAEGPPLGCNVLIERSALRPCLARMKASRNSVATSLIERPALRLRHEVFRQNGARNDPESVAGL